MHALLNSLIRLQFVQQLEAWADEYKGDYELKIMGRRVIVVVDPIEIRRILVNRPSKIRRGIFTVRLAKRIRRSRFTAIFWTIEHDVYRRLYLPAPTVVTASSSDFLSYAHVLSSVTRLLLRAIGSEILRLSSRPVSFPVLTSPAASRDCSHELSTVIRCSHLAILASSWWDSGSWSNLDPWPLVEPANIRRNNDFVEGDGPRKMLID